MKRYCVEPGARVKLQKHDPSDSSAFDGDKKSGRELAGKLNLRLEQLQELLYAEGKNRLLVVLQAMDAGGKDGTIRHVFEHVNPQGVKVASFKAPTVHELAHDYLWRIHRHAPAKGQITIFNRSHYEDVLVVRVKGFAPKSVWSKRYEHINAFEKLLADEGTTILKFFLHISLDEQKERFQSRLDEPHKHWKFSKGDLEDRKLWPEYMKAFEDVLGKTSTDWAPWYIVPANRKWYRNLVISQVIVNTMEKLRMKYPQPEEGLDSIVIE